MKRLYSCLWAVVAIVPVVATAETMYVSDQLTVVMRADAAPTAAAVKTISTGAPLEVMEQRAGFVRVRDAQDAEGWVEAALLSSQPPAANQVKAIRAELDRTRGQLVQVQMQLDKQRAAAAPSAVEQLQAELSATKAQLAQVQAARGVAKSSESANGAVPSAPSGQNVTQTETGGFSVLWLVIGFAMLVVGFIGGVVWVRESIRRRMGGLYLRI